MCHRVDKPSRGEVHLGGVRIGAKTPDSVLADIRLHNLGFVFQVGRPGQAWAGLGRPGQAWAGLGRPGATGRGIIGGLVVGWGG